MKIALIGDIHFGKHSATAELAVPGEPLEDISSGAAPLLAGFTEIIKEEKVDYLFVAGDLTSTGSPVEYSRCLQKILEAANEAGIENKNVIICTGNHDVDWRISKLAEGYIKKPGDGFPAADLKRLYQEIAAAQGQICTKYSVFTEDGPAPFSGYIQRDQFIAFVLNSGWRCSHDEANRHGKLCDVQLRWLEDNANRFLAEDKWKVLLLHHHPLNYKYPTPGRDISVLEDGPELLDIAGKAGINLICHGHRHHPKADNKHSNEWKSPITFVCAGSFSANAYHRSSGSIPNTFHLLRLEKADTDKCVILHSYQYTPSDGWIPVRKNCPETPLDPVMVFSRPFDATQQEGSVRSIITTSIKPDQLMMPTWINLPLDLKSLTYDELNTVVKSVAGGDYQMIGNYPQDVVLLRRGL